MDKKLYKTIKQLVKLGIIGKNTIVTKRKKKRRNNKKQLLAYNQQLAQSGVHGSSVTSTPTIASEQGIANLKLTQLALENAIKNKDVPVETKDKMLLTLNDVQEKIKHTNKRLDFHGNVVYDKLNLLSNSEEYLRKGFNELKLNTTGNSYFEGEPQTKASTTGFVEELPETIPPAPFKMSSPSIDLTKVKRKHAVPMDTDTGYVIDESDTISQPKAETKEETEPLIESKEETEPLTETKMETKSEKKSKKEPELESLSLEDLKKKYSLMAGEYYDKTFTDLRKTRDHHKPTIITEIRRIQNLYKNNKNLEQLKPKK